MLVFLTHQLYAQHRYTPKMVDFKGYMYEVYNENVYFLCFSPNRKPNLNFTISNLDKNIAFEDSNLILLLVGTHHPNELSYLFHNKSYGVFFDNTPNFIKEKLFFNHCEFTKYSVSRKKIHFTAFSFSDYNECIYGELIHWGIFSKNYILPENIISKNKFYIITYFY